MKKKVWILLCVVLPCAAFTGGLKMAATRERKADAVPRRPRARNGSEREESDRVRVLQPSNEELQRELARKEERIAALEKGIGELRERLSSWSSPQEEDRWSGELERRERERRRDAVKERAMELRAKILQRKDRTLRQQALAELAGLFQSGDTESLMLGLRAVAGLPDYVFEKESFKPHVLAALNHEDSEVRYAAFMCAHGLFSWEENADIHLSMTNDPSPEIRKLAAKLLWPYLGVKKERDEKVAAVLSGILRDGDAAVKAGVLGALSSGYDYGEEMEDFVIEMSRDPETRESAHTWMSQRETISSKIAERLIELFNEGHGIGWTYGTEWMEKNFTEDARPIVCRFCLDVVQDDVANLARLAAVKCLRNIGDVSALPELEAIATSPRAAGIEEELSRTIGRLRGKLQEQER
jgi:hypothetical protein